MFFLLAFGEAATMVSYWTEWHLKGTGVWTGSLVSISINLLLLLAPLRRPRQMFTKASFYTILIALTGISVVVIHQEKFIKECINPADASSLLLSIREFTKSKTCIFLRQFFPRALDLLVLSDGANRYILICSPQHKPKLLSWIFIIIYMGSIFGISSLLAALEARMEYDRLSLHIGFWNPWIDGGVNLAEKTWVYQVALKATISLMVSVFQVVLTTRICQVLAKGVQFLMKSNAGSKSIAKYTKIKKFSTAICLIVVLYNLILYNIDLGLMVSFQLNIFRPSLLSTTSAKIEVVVRYVLDILFSFKPGIYGIVYNWMKFF